MWAVVSLINIIIHFEVLIGTACETLPQKKHSKLSVILYKLAILRIRLAMHFKSLLHRDHFATNQYKA